MDLKFGKMINNFYALEKGYKLNQEISWKQFNLNQKKNKNNIVLVKQEDFKFGTLRIREPCMIKLTENILFNPNRPTTWIDKNNNITTDFNDAVSIDKNRKLDWWPDSNLDENKEYFEKEVRNAYRLGFFAALALESEDIIINLNNYTLQQHPEHALQQRFFSIIELADQPFIPKQGPGDFGKTIRSASKVSIVNGKLGLSSHHGIHGNNINNILVKDVDFIDNEVCSIALNGCNDVIINNVNIIRNRHDIPVLGTYSAGRFIKLFTNGLVDSINIKSEDYDNYLSKLNEDLDKTFNSVILKNEKIPEIFENKLGLIDGNYYGIIIHPVGIAINAPLKNRKSAKANESNNVLIKSVSINNIKTNINEILALRNKEKKIMTSPSGAIFQFMISHELIDGKYYYKPNSLSNLQIELVQVLKDNPHLKKFLGNVTFDEGLLIWRNNKDSYFTHNYDRIIGHNKLEGHDYDLIGNGDTMFHVNKGTFGMRIDGLNTGVFDNLSISNIQALGKEGSTLAGNYLKSHPKQNHLDGYHGHFMYGIHLNASNDITLDNVSLNDISSKYGTAHGLNINAESNKINIKNTKIENISACQIPFDEKKNVWPNLPTNSRGLFVNNNCDVTIKNFDIKNIIDTPKCILPADCELYSLIKQI